MDKKKRNILLIALGTLIVFGIGLIIGKVITTESPDGYHEEYHAINGEITSINDNILTVKDIDTLSFYSVTFSEGDYEVGDVIAIYSKSPILETYPAQVKASKIEMLEKYKKEEIITITIPIAGIDIKSNTQINESNIEYKTVLINEVTNTNIITNIQDIIGKYAISKVSKGEYFYLENLTNSPKTNNNPNNNSGSNSNSSTKTYTEVDVVNYVNSLNTDLNQNNSSESFTKKVKSGFVTVVDFIFYNGEIYGYTFSQLSNSAKQQILKAALWIDSKIEILLPGYKETIGTAYNNIKNKIITAYLDLTTKICTNDPVLCEQAKIDFGQMKDSFSLTWDFLKELVGSGLNKLSEWYLIWRET